MTDQTIIDAWEHAERTPHHGHKPPLAYHELRDIIDLALWAGQMLLQHGANSQRVEETVHHIGTGLGCDWLDVIITTQHITITAHSNHEFRTKTRRVTHFGVDMSQIAILNDLSRDISTGRLRDRQQVRQRLKQIDTPDKHYSRWTVALAVGLACAAFSRLFGADLPTFGLTMFASTGAMLIRQELHKRHVNALFIVILAALFASLTTILLGPHVTTAPQVALSAAVLLLVPGVPLINAAQDLISGHTTSGIARGMSGFLISLAIALGIALALGLTGWSQDLALPPAHLAWGEHGLWAAIAATGFAILFNVPPQQLLGGAVAGAVGVVLRTTLLNYSWRLDLATLFAAAAVGFLAERLAHHQQTPTSLFAIPGIIPMVPGRFAFTTLLGILELAIITPATATPVLAITATNAIQTGLILAALAVGITMPRLIFKRRPPVV
ncbi:MAG TPA: threonine/serine exporter family protein [Anaerolineae bacterium]|nr:threonine/serine exporter family protein [Anaerolineae bacterium]